MAKEIIQQVEENRPDETHADARMKVSVVSFSYPRGVPDDPDDDYWGGFVFDCRSLPDPHGIAALKGMSGLDKPVVEFFEQHKAQIDSFLEATESSTSSSDTGIGLTASLTRQRRLSASRLTRSSWMDATICRWRLAATADTTDPCTWPSASPSASSGRPASRSR